MKIKKFFWLSFCLSVIRFFVTDQGRAQPKPGTDAPIITHAFGCG